MTDDVGHIPGWCTPWIDDPGVYKEAGRASHVLEATEQHTSEASAPAPKFVSPDYGQWPEGSLILSFLSWFWSMLYHSNWKQTRTGRICAHLPIRERKKQTQRHRTCFTWTHGNPWAGLGITVFHRKGSRNERLNQQGLSQEADVSC